LNIISDPNFLIIGFYRQDAKSVRKITFTRTCKNIALTLPLSLRERAAAANAAAGEGESHAMFYPFLLIKSRM
jgi:hypothetical protein